jgi:hypothetical protein
VPAAEAQADAAREDGLAGGEQPVALAGDRQLPGPGLVIGFDVLGDLVAGRLVVAQRQLDARQHLLAV